MEATWSIGSGGWDQSRERKQQRGADQAGEEVNVVMGSGVDVGTGRVVGVEFDLEERQTAQQVPCEWSSPEGFQVSVASPSSISTMSSLPLPLPPTCGTPSTRSSSSLKCTFTVRLKPVRSPHFVSTAVSPVPPASALLAQATSHVARPGIHLLASIPPMLELRNTSPQQPPMPLLNSLTAPPRKQLCDFCPPLSKPTHLPLQFGVVLFRPQRPFPAPYTVHGVRHRRSLVPSRTSRARDTPERKSWYADMRILLAFEVVFEVVFYGSV
jgi:hypothetical protein